MTKFSFYKARYLFLFGAGFLFSVFSFASFLDTSYRQYSEIQLSPGGLGQDFFTPAIIFITCVYVAVTIVMALALFYSWKNYRELDSNKNSKRAKLDAMRAKSPFFNG